MERGSDSSRMHSDTKKIPPLNGGQEESHLLVLLPRVILPRAATRTNYDCLSPDVTRGNSSTSCICTQQASNPVYRRRRLRSWRNCNSSSFQSVYCVLVIIFGPQDPPIRRFSLNTKMPWRFCSAFLYDVRRKRKIHASRNLDWYQSINLV